MASSLEILDLQKNKLSGEPTFQALALRTLMQV